MFSHTNYHPSPLLRKFQIFLLILIIIGIGLLATQKIWVPKLVAYILNTEITEPVINTLDIANLSYVIKGETFVLTNGIAEKSYTDDSTTKNILRIFGQPEYGDLDADDDIDAAVLLEHNPGGSGTFYYAALAINTGTTYRATETMFLGDRIAPQSIDILEGRAVFNIAERRADEPMSAQPSIGRSIWVHYNPNTNEIGEWVKDFEGESDTQGMIY